MNQNPRGLALVQDELSGWVNGMNQYKGHRGSDVQFYLTAWSGGYYAVDRKNLKEPIVLPETYLAVIGGVQTEVHVRFISGGEDIKTRAANPSC